MESRVIFYDGQDNDPADYNNLQDFVGRSLDDIVGDAVTDQRKFAGFATAATGATTVTAQPGRLFSGGKVYSRENEFEYDFTTKLPVAARKIAVLVTWGEEVDTDNRPREFLINEETGASEPRVVSMERKRDAKLSVALGAENADPIPPILDSGVTAVATIVLTPTGIDSVTLASENALDSVQSVSNRIADVEDFQTKTSPQIASLASDLAALTKGQASLVDNTRYGRTLDRLAILEAKDGIPAAAVDSKADFLLDDSGSDLAFAGSSVRVNEGIRFDDEQAAISALQIFDALNPRAKIVGGVMLPAYTRAKRMSVGPKAGEVQVSSYSYATHTLVQKTMSRHRVRHGRKRTVSTSVNYYKNGRYDTAVRVFRREDEAWTTPAPLIKNAIQNHHHTRQKGHWEDTYEVPYWDEVTVSNDFNGTQVAETFLQANDMWLDAVGLTFTRLAADGTVTVAICETDRGLPLLDKVISTTTVARASLKVNDETVIPVQPTFLTGGNRYAIVVITTADHWLATAAGASYPQGTFFYVLDGAYQQGDATKDLMFSLYAASFAASRAVIDMAPLSLAGGIADVDILASAVLPGSTQLTYEIQVGATWYPLSESESTILGAGGIMPPLLPLRAVFTGTPDVMPAITLTNSQVKVSRPKTALTYFSANRALPGAGSTQIRATYRLENFDAAHHTFTPKILTGAGFVTEAAATSVTDVSTADGAIERTAVFNLGAAVTAFKLKALATTDDALNVFHVATRKDYAL